MAYATENGPTGHLQPCEGHLQVNDDPILTLPAVAQYNASLTAAEYYQTGGYWHIGTQMMDCLFQTDRIADVAFDPLEELIWCVTRTGQMSAFYSTTLERYITLTVPLISDVNSFETVVPYSELKQVFPSPRLMEHSVFVLANNALHAYTKMGRPLASAVHKFMLELECLAVTGPTGAFPGPSIRSGGAGSFSRFFLGGLQPTLLEVDATERWGEVISTIDVGIGGSVVLRPFSGGLCAGNTNGKVMIIDPRTNHGIVRELDAHTGEISDITVDAHSHTLVTCGWSRIGDSGLRVDRLLRVYDLRSGRAQVPLSASLDPCFVRFIPGCGDSLLIASQTGQVWLNYDRLVATDISQNGNCAVFATEAGQLQLYIRDLNVCQFNTSPLPTEFASPFAESLWPTNTLQTAIPVNYSLMIFDNPDSSLYGTNLAVIAEQSSLVWKSKSDKMCTSDWPQDLNESQRKVMEKVDSDLLNNANQKRAVRKPPHWGSVWHPYSSDITMTTAAHTDVNDKSGGAYSNPLQLGRFEHTTEQVTTTTVNINSTTITSSTSA
ncbi:unnamed protein product [Heterobilharzia americana]|nr:unnamed protein product [Heterobilharzia americana]